MGIAARAKCFMIILNKGTFSHLAPHGSKLKGNHLTDEHAQSSLLNGVSDKFMDQAYLEGHYARK